jgi:signal transduction histidine kinase
MTQLHARDDDSGAIEVLAIVAHELRNPLAAIQFAARALKAKDLDATRIDEVRTLIDRQVQRIFRITNDLLDVTRIATGNIALRKERVDLASVVLGAMDSCRPTIDAGGHTVIVQLPPQTVYVEADPVWLAQVVVNLLDNSAKYSDDGSQIVISVDCSPSEATIRVCDQGIGIPADAMPHLFELFVRGGCAQSQARGGMGIGLNVVKRIVQLHEGTVEAYSEGLGCGSAFTVRVPC